jgi:hypothetical protein
MCAPRIAFLYAPIQLSVAVRKTNFGDRARDSSPAQNDKFVAWAIFRQGGPFAIY